MFYLVTAWATRGINNWVAGDLGRHEDNLMAPQWGQNVNLQPDSCKYASGRFDTDAADSGRCCCWSKCRVWYVYQHIETETQWPPFSRGHLKKNSWMKIYGFRLGFHWNLFLTFELTILALVQIMAWRRPMVVNLLTHIYIYMPLGFNELIRYARSSLDSGWCGYNAFQTYMKDSYLEHNLLHCPRVNTTGPQHWFIKWIKILIQNDLPQSLIHKGLAQNERHFTNIFKYNFANKKTSRIDFSFTKVYSLGLNWWQVIISTGNCLAPTRRQAIVWINADPVHLRLYALLGLDGLGVHDEVLKGRPT